MTQIIPTLSKYGPRIVSSAQPGTKYPYLPISSVKSGGEHPFETRDPLCTKISKFTYGRNDLSPLLRIALVIAYKGFSSLFIIRGHVCSYALFLSVIFKPRTLLFSPFVYPICIDLLAKKKENLK